MNTTDLVKALEGLKMFATDKDHGQIKHDCKIHNAAIDRAIEIVRGS